MMDKKARMGKVAVHLVQEPRWLSLVKHSVRAFMPHLAFDRDHHPQVV